jgi:hypothetical protein
MALSRHKIPFGNDWAGAQRISRALQKLASAFDASGALADIGGDWRWLKEAFHLKQHYGVVHCCVDCGAAKSLMHGTLYSDFREDASWLGTNRDCMEYIQSTDSELAQIPGFHLQMAAPGVMHLLHLGVGQWAIGSMLKRLSTINHFGIHMCGSRVQRLNAALAIAYTRFRTFAKGMDSSQRPFTANMLGLDSTADTIPLFKGKAGNTRVVLLWLNEEMQGLELGDEETSLVAMVVWGLCDNLRMLHNTHRPHFTPREADRFAQSGRILLQAWASLATAARARGEFSWPIKPKLHAYDHLIRRVRSTRFNPASVWEFADEDLNGKLVRVTRAGIFAGSKRTYASGSASVGA